MSDVMEQVCDHVIDLFHMSYTNFAVNWSNRNYDHPLDENECATVREHLRQVVANGQSDNFYEMLLDEINTFVRASIIHRLLDELDPDEFLNILQAYEEHLKTVTEWLERILRPLEVDFYKRTRVTLRHEIRQRIRKQIYGVFKSDLANTCIERVSNLREAHPYTSVWAYDALIESGFATTTSVFPEFFANEVERLWRMPYYEDLLEFLDEWIPTIPYDIHERDFVAFATKCVMLETTLFQTLCGVSETRVEAMRVDVLVRFCREYSERIERGSFVKSADLVLASDFDFDANLISDLVEIHYYSYEERAQFLTQLSTEIKKKFSAWIDTQAVIATTQVSDWPLQRFKTLLDELRSYQNYVSHRFEFSVSNLYAREWVVGEIQHHVYGNMFKYLKNEVLVREIEHVGEFCVKYLCGQQKEIAVDDVVMSDFRDIDLLCSFFVSLANQRKFMDAFRAGLIERITAGKSTDVPRLTMFLQSKSVNPYVSNALQQLIRDIEKSKETVESFSSKWDTVMNTLPSPQDEPRIGVSTLILKKRGWPEFENNLLIRPTTIAQLHSKFEQHVKSSRNPEETITAVNCLSFVTIRTPLFSGQRDFIRMQLSVYQLSLLSLFKHSAQVTMQDVYDSLIRADISRESTVRTHAEEVVNLITASLMKPHALIECSSTNSEFLRSDTVTLNTGFSFDEDYVELPPPVLRHERRTKQGNKVEAKRTRNAMREKVAEMMIKNRMRQARQLVEKELVENVFEKAQKHSVERDDIEFAISSLISRDFVKRMEGDESVLEYVQQDED